MSAVRAIFMKELRVEFRSKQMINTYIILSVMILASFRFAFSVTDLNLEHIASPLLWITFFFCGMFSLAPTYKREIEQGTNEGLLLAPISPAEIFFGKLLANMIVIFLLEAASLVLFFVFFPIDAPDMVALSAVIILGTIGFASLGNVISAMSSNMSQSEVMLPVLLTPIMLFTVIMSAVSATTMIFMGEGIMGVAEELRLIIGFDVVFLAIGYLLMDHILGE